MLTAKQQMADNVKNVEQLVIRKIHKQKTAYESSSS